jgi:tetratricopeptide (TPR) repeat protein
MTLKVPWRLQRRPGNDAARALLLASHQVADLVDLLGKFQMGTLPRIFAVADGFLLMLTTPTTASFPGTFRLKALASHLFLPVDAELSPALLEDELRGLVSRRGLVFLPGGRLLSFDPDQALPLSTFLTLGPYRRREWRPFPAPRQQAERIRELALELPSLPPEEIIESEGGQDIGTEEPRPERADIASTVAGHVTMGLGQFLVALGQMLRWKGLKDLGARWIQSALGLAPRLSEALLGRQEAALRALLREFRKGNLERALRRALPLRAADDRGPGFARNAQLPWNKLIYSLREIFGTSRDGGGAWLVNQDTSAELINEYRKAAEAALKQGDYRRAAYIYGKLLRDYRLAASALFQGGLFHDAAVIYLRKLDDHRAAARAFAAAGELDRALTLYRQHHEYLEAGDLLCQAGEREAALVEYQKAAELLIATPGGYLAAGELLLNRNLRPDLAWGYFQKGWGFRPHGPALACAIRLAQHYADQERPDQMLVLLGEADDFLSGSQNTVEARHFYNEIATLADRPALAKAREELRDRALLGIAAQLRRRAEVESRPGNLISSALGRSGVWPAEVVTDAQVALKRGLRPERLPAIIHDSIKRVQFGTGAVTAVAWASATGEVFVGFGSGALTRFCPETSAVTNIAVDPRAVATSLAVDPEAEMVVALWADTAGVAGDSQVTVMRSYVRSEKRGDYRVTESREMVPEAELTSILRTEQSGEFPDRFLLAVKGKGMVSAMREDWLIDWQLLCGSWLNPRENVNVRYAEAAHAKGAFLLPWSGLSEVTFVAIDLDSVQLARLHPHRQPPYAAHLGWRPDNPKGNPVKALILGWLHDDRKLELAGLNEEGRLHWSDLRLQRWGEFSCRTIATPEEGYRAAALLGPGTVAGVKTQRIDWLLCKGNQFSPWAVTRIGIPGAVAAFPSHPTEELIVVCEDGCIVRLPIPHR